MSAFLLYGVVAYHYYFQNIDMNLVILGVLFTFPISYIFTRIYFRMINSIFGKQVLNG